MVQNAGSIAKFRLNEELKRHKCHQIGGFKALNFARISGGQDVFCKI
jgi:hypothetical protein